MNLGSSGFCFLQFLMQRLMGWIYFYGVCCAFVHHSRDKATSMCCTLYFGVDLSNRRKKICCPYGVCFSRVGPNQGLVHCRCIAVASTFLGEKSSWQSWKSSIIQRRWLHKGAKIVEKAGRQKIDNRNACSIFAFLIKAMARWNSPQNQMLMLRWLSEAKNHTWISFSYRSQNLQRISAKHVHPSDEDVIRDFCTTQRWSLMNCGTYLLRPG